MFPGDLQIDALFEDHEVSCTVIEDMVTLERAVYQRCTPRQLPPSGIQKFNRRKCVRFLQDLVAAAVLPPHSADFPPQLLDFAHARSERRDNDIHIFDVLPLAAAVYIFNQNGCRVGTATSVHSPTSRSACGNRRTPSQAPAPQRTQRGQFSKLHVQREFDMLEVLNNELATPTPAAWIEISGRRLSLWEEQQLQQPHHPHIPLAPPIVFPDGAHLIADTSGTIPPTRIPGPVKLEPPLGSCPSPPIAPSTVAPNSKDFCAIFVHVVSPCTLEVYLALSLCQKALIRLHAHDPSPRHISFRVTKKSVLDVRFLRSEYGDVSIVDNRTHVRQRSFDVSVKKLMLRFLPHRTSSNLASPSTYIGLPFASVSFTVFVACVCVTPYLRIGHTLLAAPESTVISTISCNTSIAHLLNLQSTFGHVQTVKLVVSSTRTRNFVLFFLVV